MRGWMLMITGIMALLVACTPDDSALPTLAEIPATETISDVVAQAENTADSSERPTLPATATISATPTHTPTMTLTFTATVTPSATITETLTLTPTPLPTIAPDDRPILSFALTAGAITQLPADFIVPTFDGTQPFTLSQTPAPNNLIPTANSGSIGVPPTLPPPPSPVIVTQASVCPFFPPGNFGTLYTANPDIAVALGCTAESPPNVLTINAAIQDFQNGTMLWLNGDIYVLNTVTDTYQYFPDTFNAGTDPETSSETPPSGLLAPQRGFLKIWSNNPAVRNGLGWALTGEQGTQASVLGFVNGLMIAPANRSSTFVLTGSPQGSGSWRAVQ
ncbi:MAG: hypothetical protein ACPG7F_02285 [Aggregatilineales bacterium]